VVNNVVVADVTSALREIPATSLYDQGSTTTTAAAFDSLTAVPKPVLTVRVGHLGAGGRRHMCSALDAVANC